MIKTGIQWADHTWSPWRGCQHATLPNGTPHPGCLHCYAETMAKRNPGTLGTWGPEGTRVRAAQKSWDAVQRWNDQAALFGRRESVFPSVCDPFEEWGGPIMDHRGDYLYCDPDGSNIDGMCHHPDDAEDQLDPRVARSFTMTDLRSDLFRLIDQTVSLDWILLTKRPHNVLRMWEEVAGTKWIAEAGSLNNHPMYHRANAWLVYSASDQTSLELGIEGLLDCRDVTPVLGVCVGPMTGPVDLRRNIDGLDWIIVEGESGPGARPCHIHWIRDVVYQCRDAGVPCFVKQLGEVPMWKPLVGEAFQFQTNDKKGGNPAEWPEYLRVRQMPEVSRA